MKFSVFFCRDISFVKIICDYFIPDRGILSTYTRGPRLMMQLIRHYHCNWDNTSARLTSAQIRSIDVIALMSRTNSASLHLPLSCPFFLPWLNREFTRCDHKRYARDEIMPTTEARENASAVKAPFSIWPRQIENGENHYAHH